MNKYFECKVSCRVIDEKTGKDKKVTLPFLVDALSFTEAEAVITKEMRSVVSGEFSIKTITPTKYTDIFFFDNGDCWYKCKVGFISVNEETGKEKKVSNLMLVEAVSVKDAFEKLQKSLKGMTVDFNAVLISETQIQDIFLYEPKTEEDE